MQSCNKVFVSPVLQAKILLCETCLSMSVHSTRSIILFQNVYIDLIISQITWSHASILGVIDGIPPALGPSKISKAVWNAVNLHHPNIEVQVRADEGEELMD